MFLVTWATLCSLFLGPDGEVLDELRGVTLLLPMDEGGVCVHARHEGRQGRTAKSLIEKTFDVTIRLPRPFFANWQKSLTALLEKVFGSRIPSVTIANVVQIADIAASEGHLQVSPRRLLNLVNRLTILWVQWHPREVSVEAMAYHAIRYRNIDRNIQDILEADLKIERLNADWRGAICAMHLGTDPKDGEDIIAEDPSFRAIEGAKASELERFASFTGFPVILGRITSRKLLGNIDTPCSTARTCWPD